MLNYLRLCIYIIVKILKKVANNGLQSVQLTLMQGDSIVEGAEEIADGCLFRFRWKCKRYF